VKAAEVMLLNHGKWHPAWQPPVLLLGQSEQGTQLPCNNNSHYLYLSCYCNLSTDMKQG